MRLFIAVSSIILVLCSGHGVSQALDLTLVQSMVSNQNELKKTDMHLSSGVAGRLWLWRVHNLWFGPAFGIYGTMPLNAGTDAILIARYRAFGEVGLASALAMFGEAFQVVPFLEINATLGSLVVKKSVMNNRTLTASPFVGGTTRVGLSYLFSAAGLSTGYALSVSNDGLLHRLELAFIMRI